MTKGIASVSVDFDALFDPDIMGDGPSSPGISSGGVALKYAKLAYGTKRANVGYAMAGVDVSNLWAAKGSAVYSLPIDGQTFNAFSSGNVSASMLARVLLTIAADGTYNVSCTGNQSTTTAALGNWLPAGASASDYQVQFTVTLSQPDTGGPATVTNSAPAFTACTANQTANISASVGQTSAQAKGSDYTVDIALKRISTGVVTHSTISGAVDSVGSG